MVRILILLMGLFLLPGRPYAHIDQPKSLTALTIDQRLGQYIPLHLTFSDENGITASLKEHIQTPVILVLVYFHCPNICSLLQQNLADTLNKLPAEPGKDYTVLSVSFDETERPALAFQRKKLYLQMIEKPFPQSAWRFLTGDKENIHGLTDAVGFHYQRVGEDFEHPVALIILASDGKIIRYLYGADPLPFDLKLALVEASQGRIGPAISKVVRFCFSYDPRGKKLVFNTLKVTGTVTLLLALSFMVYLLIKGKKHHPEEG